MDIADLNGVPLRRRLCVEERFNDSATDWALPDLKTSASMSTRRIDVLEFQQRVFPG
jgi:hypothetical protein